MTIHVDKIVENGNSTTAKVFKSGQSMIVVIPELILIQASGFTKEEQKEAILKIASHREEFIEQARRERFAVEI